MATPAFLRYLPARLKPLSSPAVWAPLTIFTLVSIFMWEWYQNPDWFNRPQGESVTPESTLTPEEEARLSEIDNIELLLENAQLSADDVPALADLSNPDGSQPAGTTPEAKLGRELANKDNPFAIYEDEYKFSGEGSTGISPALTPSTALSGSGGTSPAATSALSDALLRQARPDSSESELRQDATRPATSGRIGTASGSNGGTSSTLPGSSSGSFNGSLDGFSSTPAATPSTGSTAAPYIRTTTEMSPPVGTTGYQAPASSNLPVFNVSPPQPSRNPYSNRTAFPSPGTSQNFAQPSAQPAVVAPIPTAPAGSYTPPSSSQPEQNRRVR